MNIAAIIMAAGDGRRFGKPKWQAEHQKKSFLEIIKGKLSEIFSNIICVKQSSFSIKYEDLLYVNNPTPELGMISSLYYALQLYPEFKGYLIFPVDHPFVEISTVKTLKSAFSVDRPKCIRPTFNDIPGHPIIIPNLSSLLTTPNYPGGLRQFMKNINIKIQNIEVKDQCILKNINSIARLNKAIKQM